MKSISSFRKIAAHAKDCAGTLVNSCEIEFAKKTAAISSVLFLFIVIITFFSLSLFFICAGLAAWIGRQVDSYVLAFIFIGIIFLSAFSIFTIWNKSIILPFFRNKLTRHLYRNYKPEYPAHDSDNQENNYPL